jgi:urease accessory protein
LAWHIGNRHTPCEVTKTHLVIRRDPVLENMLRGLGANLVMQIATFRPEGGAYGFGRTFGHSHD